MKRKSLALAGIACFGFFLSSCGLGFDGFRHPLIGVWKAWAAKFPDGSSFTPINAGSSYLLPRSAASRVSLPPEPGWQLEFFADGRFEGIWTFIYRFTVEINGQETPLVSVGKSGLSGTYVFTPGSSSKNGQVVLTPGDLRDPINLTLKDNLLIFEGPPTIVFSRD